MSWIPLCQDFPTDESIVDEFHPLSTHPWMNVNPMKVLGARLASEDTLISRKMVESLVE